MIFDDDQLSVRSGTPQGKSTENRMLQAMGGQDTIKKRFQTNVDGSVVMAHTRGAGTQPEFTSTTIAKFTVAICQLEMDSGIVDLINVSDLNPDHLLPGLIYRTNYVAEHVGTSTTAIGSGKLVGYPSFNGSVVSDGAEAKAFSPPFAGYVDRKKISSRIPSSIFTGRTRLYVQSLYGGNWPGLVLSDASSGVGRPILSVTSTAGYPEVYIHSGSGIYFDNTTKSHFLISPGTTSATITPMVLTTCAEKYRLLLVDDVSLSADDQERIESYILSQSVPFYPASQTVTYESTPSEALGYSWHFNWDGNKCDIVNVDEIYIPSSSCYGFETTHYRLEFTLTSGIFSVVRSIVSGPSQWSVPKHVNVIAYPDWFGKVLVKAGNLPSVILPGSHFGPLYCFYQKNDLKVLSVSTTTIPSNQQTRVSSPAHFGGTYYPYWTGFLIEEEDGETVARNISSGTQCFFSIGGSTVGGNSDSSTKTTHTEQWWKRIPFVEATGAGYDSDNINGPSSSTSTNYFDDGTPNVSFTVDGIGRIVPGAVTYPDRAAVTGVTYLTYNRYFYCSFWKKTDESITEVRSGKTLIVIPFQDAESVYVSDQNLSIETGTATTGEISGIDIWGETDLSVIYPGIPGYQHYGHYIPLRSNNGSTPRGYAAGTTAAVNRSSTTGNQLLVSSQGTFTASTMPGSGSFYSTVSAVSQLYATTSSVNGTVNAPDTGVQSGSPIFPAVFSFVGWA